MIMSKPKVFIFAPVHRMGASHKAYDIFEDTGWEIVYGRASWHTPQGDNEDEMCEMAKGADALTGGSIKSSPITGRIMDSAPELRIIAKCSIGVDDVDVDAPRKGVSWLPIASQNPTGPVSLRAPLQSCWPCLKKCEKETKP